MEPTVVHIAVLAIAQVPQKADRAIADVVGARARSAGHRIAARAVVADTEADIRDQLELWLANPEIDVVIAIGTADSQAASAALKPLVTETIPGFTDLFRLLAFQEIGASAMTSNAEAARCDATFVFVLPASMGAASTAMDKLILPQLDSRTTPRNLVTQMPRLQRVQAVPEPVVNEKTEAGLGLPRRLPAKATGKHVIVRRPGREGDDDAAPPNNDVTKRIELDRLQREIAAVRANDAPTRPHIDLAKLLPRLPPGADPDQLDDVGDVTDVIKPAPESDARPRATSTPAPPPIPETTTVPPAPKALIGKLELKSVPAIPGPPPKRPDDVNSVKDSKSDVAPTQPTPNPNPRPTPNPSLRPTPNPSLRPTPNPSATNATAIPSIRARPAPDTMPDTFHEIASGSPDTSAEPTRASERADTESDPTPDIEADTAAHGSADATPDTKADTVAHDSKRSSDATGTKADATARDSRPDASSTTRPNKAARTKTPSDTKADTKPDAKPDAKPDTRSDAKPDAKPDTRSDAKPDSKSDARPDAKPDSKSDIRPDAKPDSKSDIRPDAKPDSKADARPDAKPDSKSHAWGAKPDAKPATDRPTDSKPAAEDRANAAKASAAATVAVETIVDPTNIELHDEVEASTPPPRKARPITQPPPLPPKQPPPPPPPVARARPPTPPPAKRMDDDLPRGKFNYPVHRPTTAKRVVTLLGLAVLAAGAGVAFVHFVFDRPSTQTVASGEPSRTPTPAPTPPTPPPVAVVVPDAAPPEIDIDDQPTPTPTPTPTPPPTTPAKPTAPTKPTTRTAPGTRPHSHPVAVVASARADAGVASSSPQPHAPADAAAPAVVATPDVADGCDEVTCVLEKYARPCCEHYRPNAGTHAGTPDTLDRVMVRAGVQNVMPRVIACGEKNTAKGTVKIAMKVGADGHVSEVSVVDTPSPGLGDCVASALRAATFGKSVNGVSFTYPFVF